jgi:hypothetical protein
VDRSFYLDMARDGRRFPIGTHLVLHEEADPEAILVDGESLAGVMRATARRFDCPLALPVMDLSLEKDILLEAYGLAQAERAGFHFLGLPGEDRVAKAIAALDVAANARAKANCEALAILASECGARGEGGPIPVGMSIGPFSLVSKLLADPIVPVFLAGSGLGPAEAEEVALLDALYPLAEAAIGASVAAQLDAGARAVFVCEPAANRVFFSPKQMREGSTVFHDYVIRPNLRLKALLDDRGADLIFHDCGELAPEMVEAFAVLDPAILSLGSPVKLWEMEPFVPMTTVLYGNLPTKKFYSDADLPLGALEAMVEELREGLAPSGHPFIVGSECDVLSMPGYEGTIRAKVEALFGRAAPHG